MQFGEESGKEAMISQYDIKSDSPPPKKMLKTSLMILIQEVLYFSALAVFKDLSWVLKFTL